MENSKKWRTGDIITVIFLVVLAIAIAILTIPFPINKVYSALEIKLDDPSYEQMREIRISGSYHINILTDDMFSGQITVSGYPATEAEMTDLFFTEQGDTLEYRLKSGEETELSDPQNHIFFGHINAEPWFRSMAIGLYENDGWSSLDGYCIVPGASTREEAMETLLALEML